MESKYAYFWISAFNLTSHDYSITWIYGEQIAAIEVERIVKIKHFGKEHTLLPNLGYIGIKRALRYLLEFLEVPKGTIIKVRWHTFWVALSGYIFDVDTEIHHHLFHAQSAYYASAFKEAAILTLDARGLDITLERERGLSQCLYYWKEHHIHCLFETEFNQKKWKFSIGYLYDLHAKFLYMESGSLMRLSANWDKAVFRWIELFLYEWDFVYVHPFIASQFTSEDPKENVSVLEKLYTISKNILYRNRKDLQVTKTLYAHIAAKIQYETEQAILYLARRAQSKTKSKNICIAGWVGLNIIANSKIIEEGVFEHIFVQPAAGDSGLSLGIALALYGEATWKRFSFLWYNLWRSYSPELIQETLQSFWWKIKYSYGWNFQEIARDIASGKIIAWFQWRSEFWPRALGYRSILWDPRKREIRDKINKIKSRELWRPLAPIVLETKKNDYFSFPKKSPYMTYSSEVKQSQKENIPWVIHIDGSARYQTVSFQENPDIFTLISEFYIQTHIPLLINTSLNVAGQPIVETPSDAIKLFLSTDIDILYINGYKVSKDKLWDKYIFDREHFKNSYIQKTKIYLLFFQQVKKDLKKSIELYFPNSDIVFSHFLVDISFSLVTQERIIYEFTLSKYEFPQENKWNTISCKDISLVVFSLNIPKIYRDSFIQFLEEQYMFLSELLKKIELFETKYLS